jgi:Uma2 family endonuclease
MLEHIKRVIPGDRMTVAEFFEYAPEDRKAELINGVLVMPSPALLSHESLQGFLLAVLRIFVRRRGLGVVLGSRTALDMGIEYQAYEPDILFVGRDRQHIVQEHGIMGAPDFIVEILSRGAKSIDRGIKRQVYQEAGVGELWLPDPAGQKTSRFYQRPAPGASMTEVKFEHGVLRSSVIPGFYVRDTWLWPSDDQRPDELTVLRELGVV